MKSLAELDQFDLESASKQQVAEMIQALLEQVKKAATELQSKDEKIQALTYGLPTCVEFVTALRVKRLANSKRICLPIPGTRM